MMAIVTTVGVDLTFIFTTLVHEAATAFTLLGILALSIVLDLGWKRAMPVFAEGLAWIMLIATAPVLKRNCQA